MESMIYTFPLCFTEHANYQPRIGGTVGVNAEELFSRVIGWTAWPGRHFPTFSEIQGEGIDSRYSQICGNFKSASIDYRGWLATVDFVNRVILPVPLTAHASRSCIIADDCADYLRKLTRYSASKIWPQIFNRNGSSYLQLCGRHFSLFRKERW